MTGIRANLKEKDLSRLFYYIRGSGLFFEGSSKRCQKESGRFGESNK